MLELATETRKGLKNLREINSKLQERNIVKLSDNIAFHKEVRNGMLLTSEIRELFQMIEDINNRL